MYMDWSVIGYVLAAIVGGVGSYIKTRTDTAKRTESRNEQIKQIDSNINVELESLRWRMKAAEKKLERMDDLVDMMHCSSERLAKIEGLLEIMVRGKMLLVLLLHGYLVYWLIIVKQLFLLLIFQIVLRMCYVQCLFCVRPRFIWL